MGNECKSVFMDSCISYDGIPKMNFSGLDHLNGAIVYVWADGELLPPMNVVRGAIKLPREAAKVTAGLTYQNEVETMPIDVAESGGLRGRGQRVAALTAQIDNTLLGTFSVGDSTPEPMYDVKKEEHQLFSGEVRRNVKGGTRREVSVRFIQELPVPMTILAVVAEMEVF